MLPVRRSVTEPVIHVERIVGRARLADISHGAKEGWWPAARVELDPFLVSDTSLVLTQIWLA